MNDLDDLTITIPGTRLYPALKAVIHAAARDLMPRPMLYTVSLEFRLDRFRAVGCDSFRLGIFTDAPIGEQEGGVFLPYPMVRQLIRTKAICKHEVTIAREGKHLSVNYGDTTLREDAPFGEYVTYQRTLDSLAKADTWLETETAPLLAATKRVHGAQKGCSHNRLAFVLQDGIVQLRANKDELITTIVAATSGAADVEIDGSYAYQALASITTKCVRMRFHAAQMLPMSFEGIGDERILSVVMPLYSTIRRDREEAFKQQRAEEERVRRMLDQQAHWQIEHNIARAIGVRGHREPVATNA